MSDAPDGFQYAHISSLNISTDNNELAAKLLSPATLVREGQIVWITDFRDGLKGIYAEETDGVSEVYIDSGESTLTGLTAIMSTTSEDFSDCYLAKSTPLFDTTYYINSVVFAAQNTNAEIWLEWVIIKDSVRYYPQIKYQMGNDYIEYLDSSNVWQELTLPRAVYYGENVNLRWHLKADLDNAEYVSLYINNFELDLSGIALRTLSSSDPDSNHMYINLRIAEGVSTEAYIDVWALACTD